MGNETADLYEGFSAPFLAFPALMALVVVCLPAAAFLGYRYGSREKVWLGYDRSPPDKIPGATSLGAMLALLGLLLGFAFSSSLNWREDRQTALIEEAAAIGSAFLSADLLEGAGRADLQAAIFDYAQTRVATQDDIRSPEAFDAFLQRTRDAQAKIWPATLAALADARSEPARVMVARSVLDMLDAHTRRIAAAAENLPNPAKLMIVATALVAIMIVGNRSALHGRPLTWRTFTFSGVLAVVIIVIFDLDRSLEGAIRVNLDPLIEVIRDMDTAMQAVRG